MLAVDVLMRVDRARADVGVVAGNDVAAAVADERHAFLDGARRAGGFDHDVGAFAVGPVADRLEPLRGRRSMPSDNTRSAPICARQLEPRRGIADRQTPSTAPASRASAIALSPTAPVPCTSDGLARAQRGALDDVHGRQQAAAAADVVVER